MRRKANTIIPLELSILGAGLELRRHGVEEFHGFMLAKEVKDREGARSLTAYGTLYRALDRMEKAGLLSSRWEDPLIAAEQQRPRRRLYQVLLAGETALAKGRAAPERGAMRLKPGQAAT